MYSPPKRKIHASVAFHLLRQVCHPTNTCCRLEVVYYYSPNSTSRMKHRCWIHHCVVNGISIVIRCIRHYGGWQDRGSSIMLKEQSTDWVLFVGRWDVVLKILASDLSIIHIQASLEDRQSKLDFYCCCCCSSNPIRLHCGPRLNTIVNVSCLVSCGVCYNISRF